MTKRELVLKAAGLSGRLDSIQALRAVAALMVVLCHIEFVRRGTVGVDIFFVISGFIMCYINARDDKDFFVHRLFRIVPLYWCATTLMFVFAMTWPRAMHSTPADPLLYISSLFFVPHPRPNGAVLPLVVMGWTLNQEMLFYVVFSLCLLVGRKAAPWLCALILVFLALLGLALELPEPLRTWASLYNLEFVAGIAVFYLLSHWHTKLQRVPAAIWPALGVGALGVLLAIEPHVGYRFYIPLKTLPACLVFLSVVMLENRVRIPLALLALGNASYSLYLLHPFVEAAITRTVDPMTKLGLKGALAAILFVFASVLVALASYRFLEKPSNLWLRQVYSRRHADRQAADRMG